MGWRCVKLYPAPSVRPSIHSSTLTPTWRAFPTVPARCLKPTLGVRGPYLLDLLGVFVADEHNDGINVNGVEPFDGVRCDVEQTVTALHKNKENRMSVLL